MEWGEGWDHESAWQLSTKKDHGIAKEEILRRKYRQKITAIANSLDHLFESLNPGDQLRIVTDRSFNAITAIEAVGRQFDIEELVMAVYRMNQRSVDWLQQFLTEKEIQATILLSSFFRENKRYERWCEMLYSFAASSDRVTVKFAWSHAKVFLAATKCGRHFVMEGSGNLSDNARIEQYIIEEDAGTYNFHKRWILAEKDRGTNGKD